MVLWLWLMVMWLSSLIDSYVSLVDGVNLDWWLYDWYLGIVQALYLTLIKVSNLWPFHVSYIKVIVKLCGWQWMSAIPMCNVLWVTSVVMWFAATVGPAVSSDHCWGTNGMVIWSACVLGLDFPACNEVNGPGSCIGIMPNECTTSTMYLVVCQLGCQARNRLFLHSQAFQVCIWVLPKLRVWVLSNFGCQIWSYRSFCSVRAATSMLKSFWTLSFCDVGLKVSALLCHAIVHASICFNLLL